MTPVLTLTLVWSVCGVRAFIFSGCLLFIYFEKMFSKSAAKFSIISWNLDGLDDNHLPERTAAVIQLLNSRNYSVVMLQELIAPTYEFIAQMLKSKYVPVVGTHNPKTGYFTATLLRINHAIYVDHTIVAFPGTMMDRNLLVTRCRIDNVKLVICNTHLESTGAYSKQRVVQLKSCFERCVTFSPEWNVILGGDLNVRDSEVSGKIPSSMYDVWVKCGSSSSSQYTWDLQLNKNKKMPGKSQPRCRFDRFFHRPSVPATLAPEFFGLTGLGKVTGAECFPSDHWGIVAFFQATR